MIKLKLAIFIFGSACFLFYAYYSNKLAKEENKKRHFCGIIEYVDYDVKGIPTVAVNGISYYLDLNYNIRDSLEKGDSLIKYSDQSFYKLIKHNTGKIYFIYQ
jgi:hypothetical protein